MASVSTSGQPPLILAYDKSGHPHSVTKGFSDGYEYWLDGNGQRVTELRSSGSTTTGRTDYLSDGVTPFFEEERDFTNGTVRWKHYINSPEGLVGAIIIDDNSAFTRKDEIFVRDHLGSIVGATDGITSQQFGYDAWGARTTSPAAPVVNRGFTGHEMLDVVGLVHMNARLYDPATGRFLSPDLIVQAPGNLQSYNRYLYVLNNPLGLVDPTGYSWWTQNGRPAFKAMASVVAAWYLGPLVYNAFMASAIQAAGGVMGITGAQFYSAQVAGYALSGSASGFAAGGIMGGNVQSAIQGAVTGSISGGVAGYFGDTYSFERVATEGVVGGVNAKISGGKFGDGFSFALGLSTLTYGNYEMRQDTIANSRLNPDNSDGESAGFFGDGVKTAGARHTVDSKDRTGRTYLFCDSWTGGCQGNPRSDAPGKRSNFFGYEYPRGGLLDHISEAFGGPHDFLRKITGSYDSRGNAFDFKGWAKVVDEVRNPLLIIPAAPFAGAALVPPSLYEALRSR